VAAFVLKYRLPNREIVEEGAYVPLKDAQRAIQLVRENANEWGIDPGKIGIMGFSAGGHLAATAGVHHDATLIDNERNTSLRPDFMILIYPVISFDDEVGHVGTKKRLIGDQPGKTEVAFFSNELHVNSQTPKSILFHADDDTLVPVENSLLFYEGLKRHNVPAELHVYSKGEHGFSKIPAFTEWFNRCIEWMKAEGIN
jgi:acetyl esterase/lipase